jgi:hypothetical protein
MYEPEETGVKSQAPIQEQWQWRAEGAASASKPIAAQNSPEITSASRPLTPAAPQASSVKPLQVWIIIALLALILIVNSIGLVLQVMPTGARGGGANFIPDQSFQGGQPQDLNQDEQSQSFGRPDSNTIS